MPRTCPNCGFNIAASRGEGARTGERIRRVEGLRKESLEALHGLGCVSLKTAKTSREVTYQVNRVRGLSNKLFVTSHQVGAALSAMCGAGLTSTEKNEVQLLDKTTQTYRPYVKDVWWLTAPGTQFVLTGKLPAFLPDDPLVGAPIPKESTVPDSLPG